MSSFGPRFGQDPTAASWLAPRLTGRWGHVTGVVPAGFEAYARILHPVEDEGRLARWSAVAEAAGTRVHPLAQWHRLAPSKRSRPGWWAELSPEEGNLPAEALRQLLGVLRRHTDTPEDCWFGLWHGYGWLRGGSGVVGVSCSTGVGAPAVAPSVPPAFTEAELAEGRLVRLPGREYLLGRGPLETAAGLGHQVTVDWFIPQSPNLCWPQDRSWFVATEIDFDSTLVGGSRALIAELVGSDELEAWPVGQGDSLQADADHVN